MKLNKFMIFLLIINFGIKAAKSIDLPDGKRIVLSHHSPLLFKYLSDKRTFDLSFGKNSQAEIPTRSNPKDLELRYNPNTGSIFVSDKEKGDMIVFDKNGKIKPELTIRGKDEFGNDDSNLIDLQEIDIHPLGSLAFNTKEEAQAAGWSIEPNNVFADSDTVIFKSEFDDKWYYAKIIGLFSMYYNLWEIKISNYGNTTTLHPSNIGRYIG